MGLNARRNMTPAEKLLLLGFEIHSTEKIQEALSTGLDVNGPVAGKSPLTWLTEMYMRSSRFSDCIACLVRPGATLADAALLAVLLDDADLLGSELRKNPDSVSHRVDLRSSFTPLLGASLLHVAAEFGLLNAARTLVEAGADIEARSALDDSGFNGTTPLFHTVNSPGNHGWPVLRLLLDRGAKADVRLSGITWGKGFEWETLIFDPTPISYAQCGLLPQFHRDEKAVYDTIVLLSQSSGRPLPDLPNVPNAYLARRKNA